MKKSIRYILATIGVGLGIFVVTPDSTASQDAQGCPVIQELSAEWWEWALSIPEGVNPLEDDTGDNCMIGQHGDTWFLGGDINGGTVVRSCTIPPDRALFFPVLTSALFDSPGICQGPESIPVDELRELNAEFIDAATVVTARLDGVALTPERASSREFAVSVPEDNLFDPFCGPGGLPAGVYQPTVADGYYVRLDPLPPGEHVLRFRALVPNEDFPGLTFRQNVTYYLTVVPKRH